VWKERKPPEKREMGISTRKYTIFAQYCLMLFLVEKSQKRHMPIICFHTLKQFLMEIQFITFGIIGDVILCIGDVIYCIIYLFSKVNVVINLFVFT
jgi:hypothetical protein